MDGTTTVGCWIIYLFARVFLAFFVIGINLQFPSRLTLLLSFSGLTNLWYLWKNISDHVAQSRIYIHIHWIMTLFYRTGCERLTHVTHVTSDSHSQSLKKKLWLHPLARESTPFDQWSASRFQSLSHTIIFVGCTLLLSNLIDRSPEGPSVRGQRWLLPVAVNGIWGIINAACWYMVIISESAREFLLELSCGQQKWLG